MMLHTHDYVSDKEFYRMLNVTTALTLKYMCQTFLFKLYEYTCKISHYHDDLNNMYPKTPLIKQKSRQTHNLVLKGEYIYIHNSSAQAISGENVAKTKKSIRNILKFFEKYPISDVLGHKLNSSNHQNIHNNRKHQNKSKDNITVKNPHYKKILLTLLELQFLILHNSKNTKKRRTYNHNKD